MFYFVFLVGVAYAGDNSHWIDPFDMNDHDVVRPHGECTCPRNENTVHETHVLSHYGRVANLLLSFVAPDAGDEGTYSGRIDLHVSADDYRTLKDFTKGTKREAGDLQAATHILENMFERPAMEEYAEAFMSWTDHLVFLFFNRNTCILLVVSVILVVSYKLLVAKFSVVSVTVYLVFLGWVVDFAYTWIRMLQVGSYVILFVSRNVLILDDVGIGNQSGGGFLEI